MLWRSQSVITNILLTMYQSISSNASLSSNTPGSLPLKRPQNIQAPIPSSQLNHRVMHIPCTAQQQMWHTAHQETIIKETKRDQKDRAERSTSMCCRLHGAHQNPQRKERRYNKPRFRNKRSSECLAYQCHRAMQGGKSQDSTYCSFPGPITNAEESNLLFQTVMPQRQ